MTSRSALAISSAVLAGLSFVSMANAASAPQGYPANTLTYSAQSVAANGNNITVPLSAFTWVIAGVDNQTGAPPATTGVVIQAPAGTTFALPTPNFFFNCGPNVTVTAGAGGSSPTNAASPFAPASIVGGNIVAGAWTAGSNGTFCQNGDHIVLDSNTNVGVTLNTVPTLNSTGDSVTIFAQYQAGANGGDSAPFPLVTLLSADPVVFALRANNQAVDVTGTGGGTAGTTPGTVFIGTGATPATPSPAGFLGQFSVRADLLLNAATGGPISTATASPNAFPTGETVTIAGNFGSITSAYLVPGATTASACVSPAPGGAIPASTVSPTQLVFGGGATGIPAPPNFGTRLFWAVCVLNGGTPPGQIQTTATTINAVANTAVAGANPINLTAANTAFGSIAPNGAVAFFQNVFGAANLYPTFFRAANLGTGTANVLAVLTFDGGPGPFTCTNPGAIAPGATPVPAGNASFILADSIATCVGQSLGAGSKHATIKLFSPSTAVLFSAISQNTSTTGDLSALP